MNKTTIWETTCKCGERIFYYPQKLLLETTNVHNIDMSKRLISLTCCSDCKKTREYEFPTEFKQIINE